MGFSRCKLPKCGARGRRLPPPSLSRTIRAVGHDHHFLSRLDRVSTEHVELALGLYRDTELVSHILHHAGVPDGAPRVAISLGYSEGGPFVVVTREGKFVTCLGAGMLPFSTPIVPRRRLDEIAEHVSKLQDRMRVAKQLAPGGALDDLLELVMLSGDCVSREEIYGLFAVNAVAAPTLLKLLTDLAIGLRESLHSVLTIRRVGPEHEQLLHAYWQNSWACTHLAVLCGVECPEGYPDPLPRLDDWESRTWVSRMAISLGLIPAAIRGAWASSMAGDRVFDHYERMYRESEVKEPIVEAMLVLSALGMRYPSLARDAKRVLGQPPGADGGAAGAWDEHHDVMLREMNTIIDDPEAASVTDDIARRYVHEIGLSRPYGSPARFMWRDEVPLSIARPMLGMATLSSLGRGLEILMAMRLLSWAARVPGEDLYPPFEYLKGLDWGWSLPKGRIIVESTKLSFTKGAPARARKEPAPNEPCPCGSGKKFKKCCWRKKLER